MSRFRVMIWVQHLLGIGHQRRAALVASHLCRQGADVCFVSGGYPLPDLDIGRASFVQLPAARAADFRYQTLLDAEGRPAGDAWRSARRDALLRAFDGFSPHALITETYPFGRGLLRFELEPLIRRARGTRPRTRLFCSVRDVIQPRSRKRNEAIADLVRDCFDAVLVHADPSVVEFGASFPPADKIRDRIRYTGYVAQHGGAPAPDAAGVTHGSGVLVSGGGGVVSEQLLEAALRARSLSRLRDEPWRVLAGPAISQAAFERLKALAADGAVVERNRTDFPALLAACRVSVSQGGYNTLLDIVQARARAVVVPFSNGDQSEQPARAHLFSQKKLVHVLASEELNPARLAIAIDQTAETARPPSGALDLGGADRSAEIVLAMLEKAA